MRGIFTRGVFFGAFLIAVLLLATTLAFLWYTRPGPAPRGASTAVLNVIAAPTASQPPVTPTVSAGEPEPSVRPPTPVPGQVSIGATVEIANTGGDGLRLRAEPGLETRVLFLGAEGEAFQISNGPQEADGYIWWYLVGQEDSTRIGWAVADFLTLVEHP